MKKNILQILLLLMLMNCKLFSNEIKPETIEKLQTTIFKAIIITDARPLHANNTEQVYSFFLRAFQEHFIKKIEPINEELMEAFQILYANSISTFEDGSDIYYSTMNRSLCFVAISLLSDDDRRQTFINDALNLISKDDIYYRQCLVFLIIDLFYAIENGNSKIVIDKKQTITNIITKYDSEADDGFINDIRIILKNLF